MKNNKGYQKLLLLLSAFALLSGCSSNTDSTASSTDSTASSTDSTASSTDSTASSTDSSDSSTDSSDSSTDSSNNSTDSSDSSTEETVDSTETADGTTMTDPTGNVFQVPESMERIISTAPSNTEILIGLGLGGQIAVVDSYSMDIQGLSEEVEGVDFQYADIEALLALEADILIASEINMAGGEDPYAQLVEAGIAVVYLPTSESIQEIYDDISFLGELTGTESEAIAMIAEMEARLQAVTEAVSGLEPKTVLFEISPAPYIFTFGADTFLEEALTLAGGVNIFAFQSGWFSPSEESILMANPQVILTNVEYIEDSVGEILSRENWAEIDAVANEQVYLIDGNASARNSQHVVIAIEQMAKALHPEAF